MGLWSGGPGRAGRLLRHRARNGVGARSDKWDFGDGLGTSVSVHPTYVCSLPGTHTVMLTASSRCDSQVVEKALKVRNLGCYLPIILRP